MTTFINAEKIKIFEVKEAIQSMVNATFDKLLNHRYNGINPKDFIVTGGCIASLLQDARINDWDIYCTNHDMLVHTESFLMQNQHLIADISEKYKHTIGKDGKLITSNAITLTNSVQFITMLTGDAEYIRSTFDYVHCMPYYSIADEKFYISRKQFDACVYKYLIVNNQQNVKQYRLQKFLDRGYTI